mmetsp:Transcript_7490/g.23406  ORF Transcript_7490/g.23406 Transcript_7490/m.23406 type:complete len:202 (-) Transcript_7490:285-890(-)
MRQVHSQNVIFIHQLPNERVRMQKLLPENLRRVCKLLQLPLLPRARQLRRLSVSPQPILPLRFGFFQNISVRVFHLRQTNLLRRHKVCHKIVQIERVESVLVVVVVAVIFAIRRTILLSRFGRRRSHLHVLSLLFFLSILSFVLRHRLQHDFAQALLRAVVVGIHLPIRRKIIIVRRSIRTTRRRRHSRLSSNSFILSIIR